MQFTTQEEEPIAQVEDALKKEGIDTSKVTTNKTSLIVKYPERFVLDTKNIRRYLIGWDWDVKKAKQMLMETIEWYKDYQPHVIHYPFIQHEENSSERLGKSSTIRKKLPQWF